MIQRRTSVARFAIAAVAAAGLVASYWYATTSRARRDSAQATLASCQRIASEIAQVRHAPQKARAEVRSSEDLGSVVEKAAATAQVPRDRVLRIDPQPARRLGKTDYLDQATEVELRSVSIKQLVEFMYGISGDESELRVSTLRLQAPHAASEASGAETWLANIVLTQRIYAPTTPHR